jgi:hypothetical protein
MHKWGTPGHGDDAPPPVVRPPDPLATGVAVLGVLMMVGAAVAAVWAALSLNPHLLDPIFPPARPTPLALVTASPIPPTTSAPSVSSVSPATSPPSASTPATPLPDVARNFVQLVEDPALSYHADLTISLQSQGAGTGTVAVSVDQSGSDLAITNVQQLAGGRVRTTREVIRDGVIYTRVAGQSWKRDLNGQLPAAPYAFADLTFDGIGYLGQEPHGGRTLDHIQVPTSYSSLSPLGADGLQADCRFTNGWTDFWLRSDGAPVSSRLQFSCTVTQGGQSAQVDVTIATQFSQFDRPLTITAPGRFGD